MRKTSLGPLRLLTEVTALPLWAYLYFDFFGIEGFPLFGIPNGWTSFSVAALYYMAVMSVIKYAKEKWSEVPSKTEEPTAEPEVFKAEKFDNLITYYQTHGALPQEYLTRQKRRAPKPVKPHTPKPEKPELKVPLKAAVRKLAQPAIGFQPLYESAFRPINTGCWIGGLPELALGYDWPMTTRSDEEKSLPMHFLAQIDCAVLPSEGKNIYDLPATGTLSFFARLENYPQQCHVVYTPSQTPTKPVPPPEGLGQIFRIQPTKFEEPGILPKTFLRPIMFNSTPELGHVIGQFGIFKDPDWDEFEIHEASENSRKFNRRAFDQALEEKNIFVPPDLMVSSPKVPLQIGGWIHGCQEVPAYSPNYIALLSLQYDELTGITFGDSGDIHFHINKRNLNSLDFSSVQVRADSC